MSDQIHISASQIDLAKTCLRKWAWRYIAGNEQSPHPSTATGTEVHRLLEIYFRGEGAPDPTYQWRNPINGVVYPVGKTAQNMICGAVPRPPCEVETAFDWIYDGVHYTGRIDLISGNQIWDHKTSSDPDKWAKTDLALDSQALLYCGYMMIVRGFLDVTFFLNYGRTDGKNKKPNQPYVNLCNNDLFWNFFDRELHQWGEKLLALRIAAPDPKNVECDPAACTQYGGCSYQSRCQLSAREKIGVFMAEKTTLQLLQQASKNKTMDYTDNPDEPEPAWVTSDQESKTFTPPAPAAKAPKKASADLEALAEKIKNKAPAPAPSPVATPVAAPVAAPVATPVAAPVAAPVATPVATPVAAPVAVPVPYTGPTATPKTAIKHNDLLQQVIDQITVSARADILAELKKQITEFVAKIN